MRDSCWECGRKESYLSALKNWFKWTRLGKWLRGYKPTQDSILQAYFDTKLLSMAIDIMKPKPFPKNAGNTIRFFRPCTSESADTAGVQATPTNTSAGIAADA